ncbi:hypothetical protein NMS_2180 [Nonlabens marinus S1-08]|uniref:Uncharacterized protein n=1 Tax=Nonlabens marinus S1-08 TaxID=1454201 RepID=W8VRE5_9FLAO|nr:hypothetical protein NMS_2180 [Nonlabens marinus S1-08]
MKITFLKIDKKPVYLGAFNDTFKNNTSRNFAFAKANSSQIYRCQNFLNTHQIVEKIKLEINYLKICIVDPFL